MTAEPAIKRLFEDQINSINYHNITHPMDVEIIHIDDRHLTVNGKPVKQDINQNWIAEHELTSAEAKAFNRHITMLQETGSKVQKAIYT
ncbi:MAG: hypothetical protein CVU03_03470 [Bacteroidetes bacterium HGW-Bacteroidetes-2]|jgi:hypothetical protein|nr:MAG: hypothetical protein CVU03_03470 [Bacteroidetes bacterium HGW-Bacteroidetes-2]